MMDRFKEFFFYEHIEHELKDYYDAKEIYLKEPCPQNSVTMKIAFDLVYTDLKCQWVMGNISESTFWDLVEYLKEGFD